MLTPRGPRNGGYTIRSMRGAMTEGENAAVAAAESRAALRPSVNSTSQILFASLAGTTIEFFDFYIYADGRGAGLSQIVFSSGGSGVGDTRLAGDVRYRVPRAADRLRSLRTFRRSRGRKTTLVAALLTMGLSTIAIGLLPTWKSIGVLAPLLLALCRFGQGLGLGGEWGGAVLLAIENAPPGKRAWYGMFPQLGAPVGFPLSGGVFLALSHWLSDEQFFVFGWRIPFLASAVLVLMGLYVRLTITETPVFREAVNQEKRVKVPMLTVLRDHPRMIVAGTMLSLATFVLFYLMTVFALSWGTTALGYTRDRFLVMQLFGILFFAAMIPVGGLLAERGRRRTLLWVTCGIGGFGLIMAPMFAAGTWGALAMMALGLSLMGLTTDRWAPCFLNCFPHPCVTPAARLPSIWPEFSGHRWRLISQRDWQGRTGWRGSATIFRRPRW